MSILFHPHAERIKELGGYTSEDDEKAISKFIPKLAELKRPIRKVRMRFETTEGYGWMNKAEEALQRIKRKLNKLQTLAIPKEGERSETISSVLLEILKLSKREGLLAKWAAKVRIYKISYQNKTIAGGDKQQQERKSGKKGKAASNVPGAKPTYNWKLVGETE
ncbi:hypothetical protein Tco_1072087 [Tanacetum coccineum]